MDSAQKKFGKIYDKYVNQIFRFIFLKTSSQEVAEDLTSEVFLKAFEKFREDPKIIKNIRAFLYQIARNKVIDFYRQREKEKSLSVDDIKGLSDGNNLEKTIHLNSDLERIMTALSSINQDYQDVVMMRYIDGLSIREISNILGRSEGAIRVALSRALDSLRKRIGEIEEV